MLLNPHQHGTQARFLRATQRLERRLARVKTKLQKHSSIASLRDVSLPTVTHLRQRSGSLLASAGLIGSLAIAPANNSLLPPPAQHVLNQEQTQIDFHHSFANDLRILSPHQPSQLDQATTDSILALIKEKTGIAAAVTLEGNSLNYSVGYVGYEQHLKRFPGDTLAEHEDELAAGLAPGRGAFGYFADSRGQFTTQDYLNEKYYLVAPLHHLPNWNRDYARLKDWYKFRKMIIINPLNGHLVVGALADSGPAIWTGKQFGASPETMVELELTTGKKKGLVLFLFVDDPHNLIPLGPVNYKISQQ